MTRMKIAAMSTTIVAGLALMLSACAAPPPPPEVERNELGDQLLVTEIENKRPVEWDKVTSVVDESGELVETRPVEAIDERRLRITYWTTSGQSCVRHDTDVVETSETVTITLFVGDLPNAEELCKSEEGKVVDLAATTDSVEIKLDAPLGDREVIDGHAQ